MIQWRELVRRFRETRISLSLFTLSVAVLVGAIFYVALSVENLLADYAAVANAHALLDTLATARAASEARGNAVHTYVITGSANSLATYHSANTEISESLANLRKISDGEQVIQKHLQSLAGALSDQLSKSDRILKSYRDGQLADTRDLLSDYETQKKTQDRVRTEIEGFEAVTHEYLSANSVRASDALRLAIIAGTMGLSLYFLVQCIVFARMDRESERRRGADSSLIKANEELRSSLKQLEQRDGIGRAISQLGEFLQNCHSVDEATELALRQTKYFLPGVCVDIGLFNDARDALDLRCWNEHRSEAASNCPMTSIAPRDCWSLRRGRVHIYVKDGGNPCCDHVPADVAHSMCIPMLGLGETCGILSLYTAETVEKSEENWAVAGMIAERLAPALANLKLQESLRAESVRDRLTGLFNRRYLDESLEREMSRARRHKLPVSVMMLDIDHFKQYNDAYGHDGGDIVLRSFGNLLVHNIRGEDFACRYGGEEFTLVLPGAAHDFALRRAEEIRAAVQRLRAGSGRAATAKITTSIGVATVPEHGDTTEKILLAADAALYLAKNSGRNRVVGAKVLDPAELHSNLESSLYQ